MWKFWRKFGEFWPFKNIYIYIFAPGGLYGLKLLNIFYYPINHCQCCFVGDFVGDNLGFISPVGLIGLIGDFGVDRFHFPDRFPFPWRLSHDQETKVPGFTFLIGFTFLSVCLMIRKLKFQDSLSISALLWSGNQKHLKTGLLRLLLNVRPKTTSSGIKVLHANGPILKVIFIVCIRDTCIYG